MFYSGGLGGEWRPSRKSSVKDSFLQSSDHRSQNNEPGRNIELLYLKRVSVCVDCLEFDLEKTLGSQLAILIVADCQYFDFPIILCATQNHQAHARPLNS